MPHSAAPPDPHAVGPASLIERLTRQDMPGEPRSTDRPIARDVIRARATGSVSELVTEQRR